MQCVVVLFAVFVGVAHAGVSYSPGTYVAQAQAYNPGTYFSRAPAFDSAVIKSDRLGGNFAYSVVEKHAYAAHTPVVQQLPSAVRVSYSTPTLSYAAQPHTSYSGKNEGYAQSVATSFGARPYTVYNSATHGHLSQPSSFANTFVGNPYTVYNSGPHSYASQAYTY